MTVRLDFSEEHPYNSNYSEPHSQNPNASQYSFLLMWLLRHIDNIRLSCKHEPSVFYMALNSYI